MKVVGPSTNRREDLSADLEYGLGDPERGGGLNWPAARFNDTTIGETVNLAARLEGADKTYGTRIQISQSTVHAADPAACEAAAPREIDLIRVAGRAEPVRIFEPRPEPSAAPQNFARPAPAALGTRSTI